MIKTDNIDCEKCGGTKSSKPRKGGVRLTLLVNGEPVKIHHFPSYTCSRCSETYSQRREKVLAAEILSTRKLAKGMRISFLDLGIKEATALPI